MHNRYFSLIKVSWLFNRSLKSSFHWIDAEPDSLKIINVFLNAKPLNGSVVNSKNKYTCLKYKIYKLINNCFERKIKKILLTLTENTKK